MPKPAHEAIFKLGCFLGYHATDSGGICHGITLSWISACMTQHDEQFIERVTTITESEEGTLVEKINLAKQKVKEHKDLSSDDIHLLDILSFYEFIALCQCPGRYFDVFNSSLNQMDIAGLSPIVSSTEMEALGGLHSVFSAPGHYTKKEIADGLNLIALSIDSLDYQTDSPISFLLSSHTHALSLLYYPKRHQWVFMDANQWPPKLYEQFDTERIAKKIVVGLNKLCGVTSDYCAFNTLVMTTTNDVKSSQLAEQFGDIAEELRLTKEVATREGTEHLAVIAAEHGHLHVLTQLAKHGVKLDIPLENGVRNG